jgi:hypothetical protein
MQGSVVVTRMKRTFGVGGNPSKGQVLDVYNDVELPYPDTKATEKLFIGGACSYVFPNKDANVNSGVIDASIGNNMEMLSTFVLIEVVYRNHVLRYLERLSCGIFIVMVLFSRTFSPKKPRVKSNWSWMKYWLPWV